MQNRNYRKCAVEHLKQGNLCKGYIDYILGEMDKLEKIEQIFKQWSDTGDNADSWAFKEIKEILEQE